MENPRKNTLGESDKTTELNRSDISTVVKYGAGGLVFHYDMES